MTDDVVIPKTEVSVTTCAFIDKLAECPVQDFHITSSEEELMRCPKFLHPGLLSPEEIMCVDDEMSKVFGEKDRIGMKTAIDVVLTEERSLGKLMAQRLTMEIYNDGRMVVFKAFRYWAWGSHFVCNVWNQQPLMRSYYAGNLNSFVNPNLLIKGMEIVVPYLENACRRTGIDV